MATSMVLLGQLAGEHPEVKQALDSLLEVEKALDGLLSRVSHADDPDANVLKQKEEELRKDHQLRAQEMVKALRKATGMDVEDARGVLDDRYKFNNN